MLFENISSFRQALTEYSIRASISYNKIRNESSRITFQCAAPGCGWRIHASPVGEDRPDFMVKTYRGEHNCVRANNPREVPVRWMTERLIPLMRNKISFTMEAVRDEMLRYNLTPPYLSMWRARQKAREVIEGGHSASYSLLPKYCEVLRRTNPRVMAHVEYVEPRPIPRNPEFKYFFLGFGTVAEGFLAGCSPWLTVDGCHLHGPNGGILLTANGLDPNGGIYPICFAVVDIENRESWNFMFHCMGNLLGGWGNKQWTFTTDRQKVICSTHNL